MSEPHDDIEASMEAVIENVDQNQRFFAFVGPTLQQLAKATIGLNRKVDGGFAAVDQRFDLVEQRLDRVEVKVDSLDAQVKRLDTTVGLMRDDIGRVESKIERVLGYVARDERKVDEVNRAS